MTGSWAPVWNSFCKLCFRACQMFWAFFVSNQLKCIMLQCGMLTPQFQAVCSRCGIISNVMQYHQLFGWDTTPRMSDIDVQNWNYIKWMVTILPPWSSYNLTMVHRRNECVLARHPRDSHTNTRQEQKWRIKMYVSDVSLGGWEPPLSHTKRGSQGGFPPPHGVHT